jgi:hypothetical protein
MNLMKSFMLGSTAVLAVASAQAADLPSRKAAPVEYVKVCDAYGAGFFYIPGSDVCLKVGGFVRSDYKYSAPSAVRQILANGTVNPIVSQVAADQDTTGVEFRGRVDLDARVNTAWGAAQTVVRLRSSNRDGIGTVAATTTNGASYVPQGNVASALTAEAAYTRFAGFTFGLGSDLFTTMPSYMINISGYPGFTNGVKQLSYTATFGGGWSASLGLESRGDFSGSNGVTQFTYVTRPDTGYNLVGNVRLDQSWGFLQLSGAIGNNTFGTNNATAAGVVTQNILPANQLFSGASSKTGYAIGLGGRLNLPQLAAGDQINATISYAQGMWGEVSGCSNYSSCSDTGISRGLGGVLYVPVNYLLTSTTLANGVVTNNYSATKVLNTGAIFTHYWTPSLRSNFNFSYNAFTVPTIDPLTTAAGTSIGNAVYYIAGANLIWSPAKNLDIGVEADYIANKLKFQTVVAGAPNTLVTANSNNSGWTGRLRIDRTF